MGACVSCPASTQTLKAGLERILMDRVPGITNMESALRSRVVAEARFLRAIHYFNLVRLFGDVPLRLEPVADVRNLTLPRSPAADVYRAIIEDLQFAAQSLPASYTSPPSRSAMALVSLTLASSLVPA